jgi:Uma2 family endonuclease
MTPAIGAVPDVPTLPSASRKGEPTWEVALAYPRQGEWTEAEYLELAETRFVELSDGCLEFLPMPVPFHQLIVKFLFQLLDMFVVARSAGTVLFAPLPVHLWEGKFREPDIVFLCPGRLTDPKRPPEGADLVIEVVSPDPDSRQRDLETKRTEYAQAGIREYWIVDPEERTVLVLTLAGTSYQEHGRFGGGATATSVLLPGFAVAVAAVFAAGQGPADVPA